MLVTIIYKGMHKANLFRTSVEVKTNRKGQPHPLASILSEICRSRHNLQLTHIIQIMAFDFHYGSDVACALYFDLLHIREVVAVVNRTDVFGKRLALLGTHKLSATSHLHASQHQTIENGATTLWDVGLQGTGVDADVRTACINVQHASLCVPTT